MPEVQRGLNIPFLTKIADKLAIITELKYWNELEDKLNPDKVLGKKRISLLANVEGYVMGAGEKEYKMWGIKRIKDKKFVRVILTHKSIGRVDGKFDYDPLIAEEELKGDPNQQAKAMFERLYKKHDKLNYLRYS